MDLQSLITAAPLVTYFFGLGDLKRKALRLQKEGKEAEFRTLIEEAIIKWSEYTLRRVGAEVVVEGKENLPAGAALFVANHQGIFDIPVLFAHVRPAAMMAKIELSKVPVFSFWMREVGCVFVDRGNKRQAVEAVKQSVGVLKSGRSFMMFPEGTRSKNREIGDFKGGAMSVAARADVPIVPVVIDGTDLLFEGNPGRNIRPGKVRMRILPPVSGIAARGNAERAAALEQIRQDMIAVQKEWRCEE